VGSRSFARRPSLADVPQWLLTLLLAHEAKKHPATPPSPPRAYTGTASAWARKAFDEELAKLAATAEGSRNSTLWDVARRLGQLCAGGELNSTEVFAALNAVAESWPNISHSRDTIRRAFEAGTENPKSAPAPRSVLMTIDDSVHRAAAGLRA
jgi:hypothetical protein